jgi:hypothetical protein
MKMLIPTVLTVLTFAAADHASAFPYVGPGGQVPNLNGNWFMNGDPNKPTQIIQRRPDGNAMFVNENGSQAWGMVQGRSVWIPEWNDGYQQGLQGVLQGNRIVWPNGTFWSRTPLGPGGPGWRW